MKIEFESTTFDAAPEETVLDCLERNGMKVASFCRSGACQTCLLKVVEGKVPASAQAGLKESWKKQGYFLSCVCKPAEPLRIARCDVGGTFKSRVRSVERLSSHVMRVLLERPSEMEYEAGQFLQLVRPQDELMRPYSVASLPDDETIELHVALLAEGFMSRWLLEATGAEVHLRGPFGECFYLPHEPERPLLLAGTGTGLAPLIGVVRQAIRSGHRGPIQLLHGAVARSGLYLWNELVELAASNSSLSVVGSLLEDPGEGAKSSELSNVRIEAVPLEQLVLNTSLSLAQCRVYLCGNADLVRLLKKKVFLAGTPLQHIHSDPFVAPANKSQ